MDIYKKLLTATIKGGARSIVEAAYEYFKKPITVIDVSYRLICQLPEEPVADIVFDAILTNQGTPEDIVRFLEESNYRNYLSDTPTATFVDWGNLSYPRIMGTLRVGSRIAGYYAILYKEGMPSEEDLQIAQIMGEILSAEIRKTNGLYLRKDEMGSFLMRDIINDNVTSDTLLSWSTNPKLSSQSGYQIVCAQAARNNALANLEFICRTLEEKFGTYCFSIIKEKIIYVLFYNLEKQGKDFENKSRLENTIIESAISFFNSYNLICGVSNRFYKITQFPEYKYMAEDMLNLAAITSEQSHCCFTKHALTSMISKITLTAYPIVYIHPALRLLMEYDKEYSTDFTCTLEYYIMSFKDLTSTANKLNIHRNTLKYRLQKISDITEIDYNDVSVCTQLLINFYMLIQSNLI